LLRAVPVFDRWDGRKPIDRVPDLQQLTGRRRIQAFAGLPQQLIHRPWITAEVMLGMRGLICGDVNAHRDEGGIQAQPRGQQDHDHR
jgi:hypothetical protein